MIIIGITGTIGAGKGAIVEYLTGQKGFRHFSVRDFLKKEIERRNIPVGRDSMMQTANELRASHSPSFIVDQLYEQAKKSGKDCIIESIRTPGEIESLRRKGKFILIAADADPKVRYERIKRRNSETDRISYNTFLENEQREMTSTDPNKQNLSRCIAEADYVVRNNGSLENLYEQVEKIIQSIKNQIG
ncbi:MAG: AAA family ATPase [Bacteroidetes bacterium]|nr:AAA family ATPase [Bacteroidota bacterium]